MRSRSLITLTAGILLNAIAATAAAERVSIAIEPVVIGTAIDAEYDGVFERLDDGLAGDDASIWRSNSERRAILEFDISSIPAGATIEKADLYLDWTSGSNISSSTNLYGFAGNGVLDAADAVKTDNLLAAALPHLWGVDVTSFVQNVVDNSNTYAGFLGVETIDGAGRNYSYFSLEIDYVPEPVAVLLLGIGTLILRTKRNR